MPAPDSSPSGNLWLAYAFITVAAWGLYGNFLHSGQVAMADPNQGRYKAFLWVGIAYVLVAILAPTFMIWRSGVSWSMPASGIRLSLFAGILGATGAFGALLAFGAGGKPWYVMSIIFAGAPVVNAVAALTMHPPKGGFSAMRWQFYVGIILAASGGALVARYKDPLKTDAASEPEVSVDKE
ncbi:MAG: hypothetical protein O2816_05200 [Planctomycetota bacterium]|nr:hypothetical protein [Planctomycetota bacterium]